MFVFTSKNFNTFSFINEMTKIVNEANMDETEEYLNIKETTNQVNINRRLSCIDRANKIPK